MGLGPELVVNGDFEVANIGAEWTYGGDWQWDASKKAEIDEIMGGSGTLSQSISITAGKLYQVGYTYLKSGTASLDGKLGGTNFNFTSGVGVKTVTVVAGSDDTEIQSIGVSQIGSSLSIDNVSVREILLGGSTSISESIDDVWENW